ncbi:MAG TPA: hypothetical protein VL131_05150, partial [Gammaproteobacteria bacterium]|nr:hypothetical protein [Gammaproteobacteria bacterium]
MHGELKQLAWALDSPVQLLEAFLRRNEQTVVKRARSRSDLAQIGARIVHRARPRAASTRAWVVLSTRDRRASLIARAS